MTTAPFHGRTALITGAGGDIGRAAAVRLAAGGAALILADHEEAAAGVERTAGLVAEQPSSAGSSVRLFDVTSADQVRGALADVSGPPDLLFNNAGVQGAFAPTFDAPIDDVRATLDVNVIGVLMVLQAFARALMAEGRPGAVVNTASMAGLAGPPNMVGYTASKAAVIGLTLSAAKDLAPHDIRVNAVSPAYIGPGAMWSNQVAEQARVPSRYYGDDTATVEAQMIEQIPMRRYGGLDEVASAVAFLLSDDASYLTGVNLEVAGGVR